MNRFIKYIKDTSAEMKHVNWPSSRQIFVYTLIVVLVSGATAGYLGLFDWVFVTFLEEFIF